MELTSMITEYFMCDKDKLKGRITIEINNQSCWMEYEETLADDHFSGNLIQEINLINVDTAEQVAFKILEGVAAARGATPRS